MTQYRGLRLFTYASDRNRREGIFVHKHQSNFLEPFFFLSDWVLLTRGGRASINYCKTLRCLPWIVTTITYGKIIDSSDERAVVSHASYPFVLYCCFVLLWVSVVWPLLPGTWIFLSPSVSVCVCLSPFLSMYFSIAHESFSHHGVLSRV